jgi:hypothetical protein
MQCATNTPPFQALLTPLKESPSQTCQEKQIINYNLCLAAGVVKVEGKPKQIGNDKYLQKYI